VHLGRVRYTSAALASAGAQMVRVALSKSGGLDRRNDERTQRAQRVEPVGKFMILIYGDEKRWDSMSPDASQRIDVGHREFAAEAAEAIAASGQLQASGTATTLRGGASGELVITDGPFVESKEAIGGFYVVNAATLDDVIRMAATLQEVRDGHSGVEIRPLVDDSADLS
jgi:hypothetical protein